MSYHSIAIDGPAGAGKSTVARAAAAKLNYLYVDTGAIYRTVALAMDRLGLDPSDPEQVVPALPGLSIRMDYGADGEQHMFLGDEDVSRAIRENRISGLASKVSALPQVRAFLLDFQRRLAREHNVIMDGRDIGTVVLPQADCKIFLTAGSEARARRRFAELQAKGDETPYEEVLAAIRQRDLQDSSREAAPLKAAEDAVVVDTTACTLEESIEKVYAVAKEKLHV